MVWHGIFRLLVFLGVFFALLEFGSGSPLGYAGVFVGVLVGVCSMLGRPRIVRDRIFASVLDSASVFLVVVGGGEEFLALYFVAALPLVWGDQITKSVVGSVLLVGGYVSAVFLGAGPMEPGGWLSAGIFVGFCAVACVAGGRNAALHEDGRRVMAELEQERGYVGSVSDLAFSFGGVLEVLDLKRILEWTATTARDLTSAGFAHVVVLDGNAHATSTSDDFGVIPTWWHPVLQELVLRGSRSDGALSQPDRKAGEIRGFIAAPLRIPGSEHNGTLVLGGKSFDDNDLRLLTLIAEQASASLASAWESPGGRDFATGLPNRDSLYRTLQEMLSQGTLVTVVCLRFEGMWDGYRVNNLGERALKIVGERLSESQRTYRYKSEELFVVLKSGSERRAGRFCAWVREVVDEAASTSGTRLTVSSGYVIADPEEYDATNAVGRARRIARGHEAASRLFPDVPEASDTVVAALLEAASIRDLGLAEHMKSVRGLARRIGSEIALDRKDIEILSLGAMLHDIGKIGVPDGILKKPGRLTPEEFDRIKQHTVMGAGVIAQIPHLTEIVPIVRHHHERNDGRGYPDGLAGKNIPLLARIVFVADAYDSMVQDRPYRNGLSHEEAVEEIRRNAGTQFDPEIAEVFLKIAPGLRAERFRRTAGDLF